MTLKRMFSVEVPDDEQGVLVSFLRLADPTLEGLEVALGDAMPTLDRGKLLSQLQADPTLANVPDLADAVDALVNMAGTGYSAGMNLDDVVDAVITTIQDDDVVELTDQEYETLRLRLRKLAKLRTVELIAKASQLLQASDSSFRSARVVTDLRPLYSGEDTHVAGGLILHQLAISARHNGRTETTYVALDSIDLQALSTAVSRAIDKDKALRAYAIGANTPILNPSTEYALDYGIESIAAVVRKQFTRASNWDLSLQNSSTQRRAGRF